MTPLILTLAALSVQEPVIEQIEKQLIDYSKREALSFVFVLPESKTSLRFPNQARGLIGLEMLAGLTENELRAVRGHYVLFPDTRIVGRELDEVLLNRWLEGLSEDALLDLKENGIKLSNLNQELRAAIFRLVSMPPSGWQSAISNNYDSRIFLQFEFKADVFDKSGRKVSENRTSGKLPNVIRETFSQDTASPIAFAPINNLNPGQHKFVPGKILKLSEIVDTAEKASGTTIRFDRRLSESMVFVSGEYTSEAFFEIAVLLADPSVGVVTQHLTPNEGILETLRSRIGDSRFENEFEDKLKSDFSQQLFKTQWSADQFQFLKTETPGMPLFGKDLKEYRAEFKPGLKLVLDFGGMKKQGMRQIVFSPVLDIK